MALQNKPVVKAEYAEAKATVLSAGTAADLELRGYAASPFSGVLLVGTSDDYREVDQKEYLAAVRAFEAKQAEKKDSKRL